MHLSPATLNVGHTFIAGVAIGIVSTALASPPAAAAVPPAHDAFSHALTLNGEVASVTEQSNTEATAEADEPWHAGEPPMHSLWFRWTAPAWGVATVGTCDSDFDTVLAIYTGDALGGLAPVASNDDSCGVGSSFAFFTQAGETYMIAVDGDNGDSGSFALAVQGGDAGAGQRPVDPYVSLPPDDAMSPADTTKPPLRLGGAISQKVVRQRGVLIVIASPAEASTVTVKGKVLVHRTAKVFRFTPVTNQIPKDGRVTVKLKLRRSALAAIRRAFKARRRLSANLTVTGKDAAGNITVKRRKITLKR